MHLILLLLPALVLYLVAYRFYASHLARRFGVDPARPTPAVEKNDGVDYVPTRPHILFAHHFSAIAAAGPILGPTWALLFGFAPAWAWIVFGAIFLGAVHDFSCLFVAIREGGRSIAEVARRTLGLPAYVLYMLFLIFNLVIINATFINLTAVALASMRAPADLGLPADQTIFHTVLRDGKPMALVGGIASTSAIALTLLAPLLGFLLVKRNLAMRYAYPLASLLCLGSVWLGFQWPVSSGTQTWTLAIALYVLLAAAVPVWLILQPREFVSVQFLYLGIVLLLASLIGAGVRGISLQAPAWNVASGEQVLGWIWPTLFITIACGAISGFHALVAGGTTCKQITSEGQAKQIGYLAMLAESGLAVLVTLAIAGGVKYADYRACLVRPPGAPADWQANPVLAFGLSVAGICEKGLGIPAWLGIVFAFLMVQGFVLDTLDVSVRLNRYCFEEVWAVAWRGRVPRLLKNFWFNSGIAVALMMALAMRNTADRLWPIFGTGNQLLAALSLLAVSMWFFRAKRRVAYTLVPAIFMGVTALASLVQLLWRKYLPARNHVLAVTDVILMVLAVGVMVMAARAWRGERASGPQGAD